MKECQGESTLQFARNRAMRPPSARWRCPLLRAFLIPSHRRVYREEVASLNCEIQTFVGPCVPKKHHGVRILFRWIGPVSHPLSRAQKASLLNLRLSWQPLVTLAAEIRKMSYCTGTLRSMGNVTTMVV